MCAKNAFGLKSEWIKPDGERVEETTSVLLDWVRAAPVESSWIAPPPPADAIWGYCEEATLTGRDRAYAVVEIVKREWDPIHKAFRTTGCQFYKVDLDRGGLMRVSDVPERS